MIPSEHHEQVSVVDWLDFIAARKWSELAIIDRWSFDESKYAAKRPQWRLPYFAAANGGNRDKVTGAIMKSEGVIAGVPDLMIMVPRTIAFRYYHGLAIEMKKREGGVISPAQIAWGNALETMGYRWKVCHGAAEAIETITDYLNGG